MESPDHATLVRAIEDARRILGDHIELGQQNASLTVDRLVAVLDREDLVHALDRMNGRRSIRLVGATAVNPPASTGG
jgi:hypothetical protein